jgi:hypothetical protein
LSFSVSASGALFLGRMLLLPGAEVAISVIAPMPTEWWLRPVSSAARVGEHTAAHGRCEAAAVAGMGHIWRVATAWGAVDGGD